MHPILGMSLEAVVATAQTATSPELRDMTRRFRTDAQVSVRSPQES